MVDIKKQLGSKEHPLICIPKWNGNDELPEKEQIQMGYKQMDFEATKTYGQQFSGNSKDTKEKMQKLPMCYYIYRAQNWRV